MRIAITGTRGIPNRYGGFEHLAEHLSAGLSDRGHKVWVYSPHDHPFREDVLEEVAIVRKYSAERWIGPAANYFYDLICLRNAVHRKPDVILECGYPSAAPWYFLLNWKGAKLVTHMDGMEWQRTKWGRTVRKLFKKAEKNAVHRSDAIVCDHPRIQAYYREKYGADPAMIAYGSDPAESFDPGIPDQIELQAGRYYLLIARLEPENNIRMVIEGFLQAQPAEILVIAGNHDRAYGRRIYSEFSGHPGIRFLGGIYDRKQLDSLRHHSKAVFHGHSVGGTNPSLLDAMSAGAYILAHDNAFNRWVLGDHASYFSDAGDVQSLAMGASSWENNREKYVSANLKRIREEFRWKEIILEYEKLFLRLLD
jgi:glycosyltransferase involved in cell wall biosynthesis